MASGSETVEKALSLLNIFSEQTPAIGLSELSKKSGFSKPTTQRFLHSLNAKGFVEQDPETKNYYLGPAFLHFALVRETSVPLSVAVKNALEDLAAEVGETAHASVASNDALATVDLVVSKRTIRVILDPGEMLPFHATASGIAYLAYAEPEIVERVLSNELEAITPHTITDIEELKAKLEIVRKSGYARSSNSYEEDVVGIAAPYFGPSGNVCGAIAVAMPQGRFSREIEQNVATYVRNAAHKLTRARGGMPSERLPD